jgi:hypothetical protein
MKKPAVNERILFDEQVTSDHPEKGAFDVHPAKRGDSYTYRVKRVWEVKRVHADGSFEAVGPHGNQHHVSANDPHVHIPSWTQRNAERLRKLTPNKIGHFIRRFPRQG